MKYVVCCMCHTIKILLSNWPRKLEFSQFLQAGRTCQLLMTFLAKITGWSRSTSNFMLWLVKIWQVSSCGKLCSILELVFFDSWNWQSFVSTRDVFDCLFALDVQNEIQLLSRVFCHTWRLVCLYWIFGWEIRRLSKSEIRFWMASFLFFTLLDRCVRPGSDAVLVMCRT